MAHPLGHGRLRTGSSPLELADIVRRHGQSYLREHAPTAAHRKVLRAVAQCRTAALGGHLEQCTSCDYERPAYNSCLNRHCPKCQGPAREKWIAAQSRDLLPVGYFHLVFTLPHELNPLILQNKRVLLGLLFSAMSQTLLTFGQRRFGGKLGITAVLHTWDQTLGDHFHLHCLVPAGALADGARWVAARRSYLFPTRALAKVFRGKYLAGLKSAQRKGQLVWTGRLAGAGSPLNFAALVRRLYAKPWVVYAKAPFARPELVMRYLGRYTHRVAIANSRLVGMDARGVTFSYRARKAEGGRARMTLPAHEFLRRYLLHTLPHGFVRIRHYGLLSNGARKQELERCRELLTSKAQPVTVAAGTEESQQVGAKDVPPTQCPACQAGALKRTRVIVRGLDPPRHQERVPCAA